MNSVFLACAVIGACVLALQIVLGAVGLDGPEGLDADGSIGEGLELLSVRAVSAGVAFFGIAGMAATATGTGPVVASGLGVVAGVVALYLTAFLTRQVLALESDGSLRIEGAIGAPATVYLPIPGGDAGAGKVQLALQGRTLELLAITREPRALPRGSAVIVVSVVDSDTVEVLPSSSIEEVLDGTR